MSNTAHQHLYPIVDILLDKAIDEAAEDGDPITCKMGCNHCCHLLVEVSWEEAKQLVDWLQTQPPERRQYFLDKIKHNAHEARALFSEHAPTFVNPVDDGNLEIPEEVFDHYFYDKNRPCAFLEDGLCAAYAHRPSACRLHLVSSNPDLCSRTCDDPEAEIETPGSIETLKEDIEPVLVGLIDDGRWGQLSIMVEAVLNEAV